VEDAGNGETGERSGFVLLATEAGVDANPSNKANKRLSKAMRATAGVPFAHR
jgi:hypothetical protein